MQIAEIIEKGPFDHSRTKVKAGCIIEKINGEEITLDNDITCLLNNKAGKKTLISIYNPQNKERWEEVVMPVTNGQLNGLLYKRWVKQRAADVEKWSKGRLGYVHIQSMGKSAPLFSIAVAKVCLSTWGLLFFTVTTFERFRFTRLVTILRSSRFPFFRTKKASERSGTASFR